MLDHELMWAHFAEQYRGIRIASSSGAIVYIAAHTWLVSARKFNIAAFNWGLVTGKTQTYLPWDSGKHPCTGREPAVWFDENFRSDGTPYRPEEVAFIRKMIQVH
jgi:hypothetical protein